MRLGELATRSLLGGISLPVADMDAETSPNPAGLLVRQSCYPGWTSCGDRCMPVGADCCAEYGRVKYCESGYYCRPDSGCCPDGWTICGDACIPQNYFLGRRQW
ncbi:hypothetical protein VTH06DRAFT_7680 [Thermothelomyces fergusii]